jgi:hypothetical protein
MDHVERADSADRRSEDELLLDDTSRSGASNSTRLARSHVRRASLSASVRPSTALAADQVAGR